MSDQLTKPLRYDFRFAPIDTLKIEPPKEFTFFTPRMIEEMHTKAIRGAALLQLKNCLK